MSDTAAPGQQQQVAGPQVGRGDKHDDSGEVTPERHDSKADNDQGVGGTQREDWGGLAIQDLRAQNEQAVIQNAAALHVLDTSVQYGPLAHRHSPASAGLHIRTDVPTPLQATGPRLKETPTIFETPVSTEPGLYQVSTSQSSILGLGSSIRSNLSTSSMGSAASPGSASALASPFLASMPDLTPLPSPMVMSDPGSMPYRKSMQRPRTPSGSRTGSTDDSTPTNRLSSHTSPTSATKRKKGYGSLLHDAVEASRANAAALDENTSTSSDGHSRNRSISDFVPEHLQNTPQRHVTYGPGDSANMQAQEYRMQREPYVAPQRGLAVPVEVKRQKQLPSPPPSMSSVSSVAESDDADDEEQSFLEDGTTAEYLEIHCGMKNKRRKFRQLRQLGQGTFSRVMLATRERIPAHPTPEIEEHLDPHKLVAVKMVEYGPAGGADEQRIETGLKREVEMLKSIFHPSLIHLKACEYQASRALLVLTYCPGGDLFDLASQKRDLLTPPMIQRIFAELVNAVQYLHANWIVHRDIKLENVLVNLRPATLSSLTNLRAKDTPIVTLTDLGLSRRIPDPPASPLLQTRCGSEDYAAPEILLGQPYDGRHTDAWALGVLLYALMEGRLPFDAPPGKPERSRNTHRIARCDWIWCRFGDEDGEWDTARGVEFAGAREVVEGLLKKVRMGRKPLAEIQAMDWVRNGIQVSGGLKMREEDEDDSALL